MSGVPYTQARRIISLFGSPYKMSQYVRVSPAQIYKWTWPKEKGGTGGLIPAQAMAEVLRGARLAGILIGPDDLYPDTELDIE